MRRGEIWWAAIPVKGAGGIQRPMLIVSDNCFNENARYKKVLCVHVTSVRRLSGPYDWEVSLPRGTAGLRRSSIAKCGEIYTLWKKHLQKPLGTLPGGVMTRIDRALAVALSLAD